MASAGRVRALLRGRPRQTGWPSATARTAIATRAGAMLPEPQKVPLGLLRVAAVILTFAYVGSLACRAFAVINSELEAAFPDQE